MISAIRADDIRVHSIIRGRAAPVRRKTARDHARIILSDDVLQKKIGVGVHIRWFKARFISGGAQGRRARNRNWSGMNKTVSGRRHRAIRREIDRRASRGARYDDADRRAEKATIDTKLGVRDELDVVG